MLAVEHKPSASRASAVARPARPRSVLSHNAAPAIQRKGGCACGGQCPRCKAQSGLTVGPADDQFEREADRIADQAMSGGPIDTVGPGASDGQLRLRRRVLEPGEQYDSLMSPEDAGEQVPLEEEAPQEEEEGGGNLQLQRSAIAPAGGAVSASYEHSLSSAVQQGGQRLPASTQSHMESRLGWDFSGVRVHADPGAHRLASQINARAFTYGHDIFFGASQYAPASSSGQRLLAHELAHVMQQSDGRLSRQLRRTACSEYPGVRAGVDRKKYNCSGLALRTYTWISPPSAVYAAMWREFINPVCPVGNCSAGQVKLWLWDYDIRTEDDLGNVVDPTWHDFHIVGGRMDSAGGDPKDVMSKNGGRPIHGPGTGPSFRPATRDRALDIDDNPGNAPNGRPLFKVRSNMHEEITCADCR